MSSVKRIVGTGIAAISLVGGILATAVPASANVGDWFCDKNDGGQLCLMSVSAGYKIWYTNQTSQSKHLDFNIQCLYPATRYGDEGSFTSNPGWTNYYTFQVGRKDGCSPLLYDYGTRHWYNTVNFVH
ncbi:hypothetical protein [Kitasatospora indigofera]|uniref:hypothetical protein n=1 Tax=Kitasatospora indigofera TaxID=67307 RepID=UPI0036956BDA